ncbi:MAG: hypothetical protein C5B59_00810 [Bacteroidetes bacterium]|nr:MAG: hypothetical protein C5B59_00810 [Bacteroidota bacterium]
MNDNFKNKLLLWKAFLLCGILATIILSLLVLNSIFIMLLLATWFFEGGLKEKWTLLRNDKLFLAYAIYFFVQFFLAMLNNHGFYQGWCAIEGKLALLVLPIIFCSSSFVSDQLRRKVMVVITLLLTAASLYCLVTNLIQFGKTGEKDLFFYHKLVSAINQHAVYFSVYIFICLVFLMNEGIKVRFLHRNAWLMWLWMGYLTGFVILLSSKMVLIVLFFYAIYTIFYHFLKRYKRKAAAIAAISLGVMVSMILVINNPIKSRFKDIMATHVSSLEEKQFKPLDYFNGLEFRLLLWRFTYEILRDNRAFITGVGPANAQDFLVKKYISMNMYQGDKKAGRPGYLAYNCHNQFLQAALQSGIIGLVAFVFWCGAILVKTIRRNNPVLSWMMLIIFVFFLSESVFERQYGIILCTFFPLLFLYPESKVESS